MSRLLKSSKFWVAVIDAVSATLAIILAWFLAPDKVNQVLTLIAIWQPIMIAVIVGTWVEDAAKKSNEGWSTLSATVSKPTEKGEGQQ